MQILDRTKKQEEILANISSCYRSIKNSLSRSPNLEYYSCHHIFYKRGKISSPYVPEIIQYKNVIINL